MHVQGHPRLSLPDLKLEILLVFRGSPAEASISQMNAGPGILSEVHTDLSKLSKTPGHLSLLLPDADVLGGNLPTQDADGDLLLDRGSHRKEVMQLKFQAATPVETVGLQVELSF